MNKGAEIPSAPFIVSAMRSVVQTAPFQAIWQFDSRIVDLQHAPPAGVGCRFGGMQDKGRAGPDVAGPGGTNLDWEGFRQTCRAMSRNDARGLKLYATRACAACAARMT